MTRTPFLEFLDKIGVVLFDGAMGTELYSKGFYLNQCYDAVCLSAPKIVREIHQAYIAAGAQAITTNSFGANFHKLQGHGFGDDVEKINRVAAELAREAAGDSVYVAGSVGPLGIRIEPWGPTSTDEARNMFRQQMKALSDGGVDLFVIETFSDLSEIHQAIQAARDVAPHLPVIASMTVGSDGNSLYGTTPALFTERLDEWGADIIGINCSVGPQPMLDVAEKMVDYTDKPLCVQPNAGEPRAHEGRTLYLASAEYLAEYAKRFIQVGVRIVGGCCGTTPEFIKAMNASIRMQRPGRKISGSHLKVKVASQVEETPAREKTPFALKLLDGKFPVSVELTPPRGYDTSRIVGAAKTLHEAGIDAVNIPDGPRASCRMSNQALCQIIHAKLGMDVIPHYCCRDRNLLGMMSDILGLAAMGLHNILLITGDPPKMGDYPEATAVFDIDSIGLTNLVKKFNQGLDLGENAIKPPTKFFIGVGCNPGAIDLQVELDRYKWKIDAGAEFAITQPVFDATLLLEWLDKTKDFGVPLMAGVWPLISYRNAEFMNNEVPGAHVPEPIMERMKKASEKGKEQGIQEGIAIAREAVGEICGYIQGLQVSAPFGNIGYALSVLEELNSHDLGREKIRIPE
ncbi:MAG: bifunctional homocysteine S-methyltransferase/methylenetetrahydrofolate reductase [Planctomycetes bacterium]|nr:bifunctional homocysteine S-methyltransferase/methylenetetrahydrofolate reductase [Planctomycetota bacterium]